MTRIGTVSFFLKRPDQGKKSGYLERKNIVVVAKKPSRIEVQRKQLAEIKRWIKSRRPLPLVPRHVKKATN